MSSFGGLTGGHVAVNLEGVIFALILLGLLVGIMSVTEETGYSCGSLNRRASSISCGLDDEDPGIDLKESL